MIDATTSKPLKVSTGKGEMSYIIVPLEQLDKVETLLNANKVSYWVDEDAISLEGKPYITFINLSRNCDPAIVQRLLDTVP